MAGTVGQFQQSAFTTPVNGDPLNASVPLSNDNAVRGKHNSHDADATIHIQSSDLATRPAFGTAQRVWWTTDEQRLYFDSGSAWEPLQVRAEDLIAGTATGNFVIDGDFEVTGAATIAALTLTDLTVTDDLSVGDSFTALDVAIGADPGGSAPLRVGGGGLFTGGLEADSLDISGDGFIRATAAVDSEFIFAVNVTGVETNAFQIGHRSGFGSAYMKIYVLGLGLKNVSVGNVDSGGAGLRALCVPNV